MQLTWEKQYKEFAAWLVTKGFENDYLSVYSDPDVAFQNMELDVLSAMWFWQKGNCNNKADVLTSECSESDFKSITRKINRQALANEERYNLFKNAYTILDK